MELFSVICTTCQSKLKVRDRGVIGQILACPKCQGMVLVQPPPDWQDDAVPPAMPAAATPASSAAAPAAQVSPAERPARHTSRTFDDAAALLSQPTASAPTAPPHDVAPEPPLTPPPGEWLSPQTQAVRRWVLIGGLATVGSVAAIGLLAYALTRGNDEVAEMVPPPPTTTSTVVEPAPAVEEPAPRVDEENEDNSAPVPPMKEPLAEPKPPQPQPTKNAAPPANPPVEPKQPVAEAQPEEAAAPKPLNTFNVEGTLKQFGALIEEKPFEEQPTGEPAPIPEGLQSEPDPAPLSDSDPLPRPDPRRIDVARRLNDPLEAIEVNGMALADFLQLLTEMTTLPITLDPTALPAIKASPEAKVSVKLQSTKVADVLDAALRPHNLAFVANERQVVVLPIASAKGDLREIKHEINDLAKSATDVKILAEMIHAVIDPTTWDDAGGQATMTIDGTTLTVKQSPEAHFAIVLLCEKLRLARQVPTRSAYPSSILSLTPRATAADAVLDIPVTMNFVPPTRLTRVADHIHRTTGMRVLIDWRALADAGWTPEGEVKAGVASQPLSVFLDRLTRRMEIAWRVIDANTVQLTSPAAIAAQADIEVYPIAVENGAAFIANLQKELGSAYFAPGGSGALRYDTAGQALVARLPQPAQRKLAEILANAK